jgi:ribosomal 50S subunit-recycling heat shock protein
MGITEHSMEPKGMKKFHNAGSDKFIKLLRLIKSVTLAKQFIVL